VIDSYETDEDTRRKFYDVPVRAGDMLWVPNQGKFIAEGWLEKPGIYTVTPGLTVRGAISAAGGLSFPAASDQIRIYRPGVNGETEMRQVDYNAIAALRTPDIYLREGDVLSVSSDPAKLPPYLAWKAMIEMVRFGAGVKVAP
jgi:hypothetical protein